MGSNVCESDEQIFVARQAILDRDENVFAYELLYRNSIHNAFPQGVSDDVATARLIFDNLALIGLQTLVGDKKAFINLSTYSILKEIPDIFAPDNIVLEIVERAEKLSELQIFVEKLHAKGYVFALDDYDGDEKWDNILPLMTYIKLEVGDSIVSTAMMVKKLKLLYPKVIIVVERVEDHESFVKLKNAGADYFQGYYFTRPQLLNFKNISSSKMVILEMLKAVCVEPFDFKLLANEIAKDAGIVSRVLTLSSAACKRTDQKIDSIDKAVVYLGENAIKRFTTVVSMCELGDGKPSELITMGLVRAKFISLLFAQDPNKQADAGYLLGLLSVLDALLDIEMSAVCDEIPLAQDIDLALRQGEGEFGRILTLCEALERANMDEAKALLDGLQCNEVEVMTSYVDALYYADEITANLG